LKQLRIVNEFIDSWIDGLHEAQFFERRIGESPSAPLIGPNAVRQNLANRALRVQLTYADRFRICHPFLAPILVRCYETQFLTNFDSKIVLSQTIWASSSCCS